MAGVISRAFDNKGASAFGSKGQTSNNQLVALPGGGFTTQPAPEATTPLSAQRGLYNSAVKQQAGDYDDIMGGYKSLMSDVRNRTPISASTYNPNTYDYQPTQAFTSAMGNLNQLSQTGGYSAGDISSIRERGISPIRSIYANANRDIDRSAGLAGGRSANYGALKAKMAREQSEQIGKQVNDVNAGIAERVAQNKIGLAPTLANTAANEQSERNRFGAANTGIMNDAQQFNINTSLDAQKSNRNDSNQIADALQGMTSLYGTTPALSNLFGNQVMQVAQNQQQQQGAQWNNASDIFGRRNAS